MAVSDRALLCSPVSQLCAPPHKLWLFIYHCAAFCPHSCVFSFAIAICVIPMEAVLTGMSRSSSKAASPSEEGASISSVSKERSAKNGKEDAKPELGESLWQGRNKKGRRREGSLPPFPAGLMQSADNVCFIHSLPLFSNHLLRDISKKGRWGID